MTDRRANVERLRELAHAVAQGREAVAREFTMRVPAEPERDADLVISTAADEIEALRAEVERLRADAERYWWLTENCLHSFSMTQEEPAEHTLAFEWSQASLDEAGWSIHDAIDAAIAEWEAG